MTTFLGEVHWRCSEQLLPSTILLNDADRCISMLNVESATSNPFCWGHQQNPLSVPTQWIEWSRNCRWAKGASLEVGSLQTPWFEEPRSRRSWGHGGQSQCLMEKSSWKNPHVGFICQFILFKISSSLIWQTSKGSIFQAAMFVYQNVTLGFGPWSVFDRWIVPMVPGIYISISLSPQPDCPGFKAITMSGGKRDGFRGSNHPKPSDPFTVLPFLLSMTMVKHVSSATKSKVLSTWFHWPKRMKSPWSRQSQFLIDPKHPWVWCL